MYNGIEPEKVAKVKFLQLDGGVYQCGQFFFGETMNPFLTIFLIFCTALGAMAGNLLFHQSGGSEGLQYLLILFGAIGGLVIGGVLYVMYKERP